ncbi:MAG: hypothetical protein AAB968_01240, partial [Patescibacteria group bacterium]
MLNQKGFSQLILLVIVGIALVASGGGVWYYQQSANQKQSDPEAQGPTSKTSARDDFGCWPPSCSIIPDPQGKQLCEDWKAGKEVQWFDCSMMADFPKCVKLCEAEKKNNPQGLQNFPNSNSQQPSGESSQQNYQQQQERDCGISG